MSWWTRVPTRASPWATAAGSGSVSMKLPPTIQNASMAPRQAASTISDAVSPLKEGHGKPQTWLKRVLCGSSSPGAQPTSAPPCTPECPRIGIIPAFSRPTQPRASPTFIRAWMVSTPWACWVSPMDHTKTPFRASRSISANRRIVARDVPLSASRVSQSCAATWAAASVNPVVRRAMTA